MLVPLYKYSYVCMYVYMCIAYFDMYKQTHADIHVYIYISTKRAHGVCARSDCTVC